MYMKSYILLSIIFVLWVFSSVSYVSANQGVLGKMLEINTWLEVYNMQSIPGLSAQSFTNNSVQKTYEEFIKIDSILRNEFIRQYRWGQISHYQMQDLVTNYKNFLYYTNKTFDYISEEEKWIRSRDIQNAINSWYSNIRIYYRNIKNIISR